MTTLAVTIGVGSDHRRYADEAASRVERYLGLETFTITEEHLEHALDLGEFPKRVWSLKFRMFDMIPSHYDRIMYFDNDWRPVREWDVDATFRDRESIYVAPDLPHNHLIRELSAAYGFEPGTYFNAGWMVLPRRAQPMLEAARTQYSGLPEHFGDQCVLNQLWAGKVTYVPAAFNVLDIEEWPDPANVMAVHTAVGDWNYAVYRGEVADRDWDIYPFGTHHETTLFNLDYSHPLTIGREHIIEIYRQALCHSGGKALEYSSFRGHSALALTLAGMNVRSVDRNSGFQRTREGLVRRYHQLVDFQICPDRSWQHGPDTFDVVLLDTQYRDRIRYQLEALWKRKVRPGGLLIAHDVEKINVAALVEAIQPASFAVTADIEGREMGFFRKSRDDETPT